MAVGAGGCGDRRMVRESGGVGRGVDGVVRKGAEDVQVPTGTSVGRGSVGCRRSGEWGGQVRVGVDGLVSAAGGLALDVDRIVSEAGGLEMGVDRSVRANPPLQERMAAGLPKA